MKIHYSPYPYNSSFDPYGEDIYEQYICGSYVPESGPYEECRKEFVTCKKCLKLIEKDERTTTK